MEGCENAIRDKVEIMDICETKLGDAGRCVALFIAPYLDELLEDESESDEDESEKFRLHLKSKFCSILLN